MIKSDRFWYRINKFKTAAGLRRSLNCDFPLLSDTCSRVDNIAKVHGYCVCY